MVNKSGLGERFEQMVEMRLQQISRHPEHYKISEASYREVSVDIFPFTIVYKVNKKKKLIYVSAIYHTKEILKTNTENDSTKQPIPLLKEGSAVKFIS